MERAGDNGTGAPGGFEAGSAPVVRRVRVRPDGEWPPTESVLSLVASRQEERARRERTVAAWARGVRRFGRVAVWALPVAAISLGLAGWFGWPGQPGREANRWVALTLVTLFAGQLAVIALAGLLVATRGRRWALAGLLATLAGTVATGPVLGLIALAPPERDGAGRAVLTRAALDGGTARWLGIAGLVLLTLGWLGLGLAVIASGVLNGTDGVLLICGVLLGCLAALLARSFLLAIAAMLLLAAGLGLAFTASRLTADGEPVPDS